MAKRERKKREQERNDYLQQKRGKRINIILFLISSHGLSVLVLTIDMLLIGMLLYCNLKLTLLFNKTNNLLSLRKMRRQLL